MKKKEPKYKGVAEAMGIDLSDRTGQYCHLDADGEVEAAGRINLTSARWQKRIRGVGTDADGDGDGGAVGLGEALFGGDGA